MVLKELDQAKHQLRETPSIQNYVQVARAALPTVIEEITEHLSELE